LRKIILMVTTIILLVSCNNVNSIQDFNKFKELFIKAVNEKDKVLLSKLISPDFKYMIGDERDNYSFEEVVENFDFENAKHIINGGFTEHAKGIYAFSPAKEVCGNVKKYKVMFDYRNEKKTGWKLLSISVNINR